MKVTREFCDAGCGFEFKDKTHSDRTGLVVTMGYSKNGWGNRRDMINWSGEVCQKCFESLGEDVSLVWKLRLEQCSKPGAIPNEASIPEARAFGLKPETLWERFLSYVALSW